MKNHILLYEKFACLFLAFYAITYFLCVVFTQKNFIFDDSFISYRYATNLANGNGIIWNINEPPVEGYSNFLLIILLVPLIQMGVNPLLTTRIFSLISTAILIYLLYKQNTQYSQEKGIFVFVFPIIFLINSNIVELSMVGLETVLFSLTLFVAFLNIRDYFVTSKGKFLNLFLVFSFFASLFRSEGILLPIIVGVFILFQLILRQITYNHFKKIILSFFLFFGVPIIIYFIWKIIHFGSIIPNPYYLKVSGLSIFSAMGVKSVVNFIYSNLFILLTAVFSFFFDRNPNPARSISILFTFLYMAFFLHVDTLMDIHNRFLFPVLPFCFFLALPTFSKITNILVSIKGGFFNKNNILIIIVFGLTFNQLLGTVENVKILANGRDKFLGTNALMQKEYQAAIALKQYPGITNIKIAFGDAGVIPFFTQAPFLDIVGLNDEYIARERNISNLTDYFFNINPDLILQPSNHENSWLTNGHGPLGNYQEWAFDSRWDHYQYVGSILTDTYDINFFLRRNMRDFSRFLKFLQEHVIDGYYYHFPIAFGTYTPLTDDESKWIEVHHE